MKSVKRQSPIRGGRPGGLLLVGQRRARRDHRADSGEGERRDLHQDRARDAAGRGAASDAASMADRRPTDAQLRQALDEVTPRADGRTSVDEMLLVQRGRELGYTWATSSSRASSTTSRRRTRSRPTSSSRRRSSRKNMTLADLRRNLERQMIVQRVQQNEVLGQDRRHRRRGARATTTRTAASSPRRRRSRCARSSSTCRATAQTVNVGLDEEARDKADEIRAARCWPARASRSWPPSSRTRRRRPTPA